MKRTKSLRLHNPADHQEIQAHLDAAFGRIETVVTIQDLLDAVTHDKTHQLPRRLLKGCAVDVTAKMSLCKSYRYKKDVGRAGVRHDGRDWLFVAAGRTTCWAGGSVGGREYAFPRDTQSEIVAHITKQLNVRFF